MKNESFERFSQYYEAGSNCSLLQEMAVQEKLDNEKHMSSFFARSSLFTSGQFDLASQYNIKQKKHNSAKYVRCVHGQKSHNFFPPLWEQCKKHIFHIFLPGNLNEDF